MSNAHLVVVGLNHRTAPVDIRERAASDVATALAQLRALVPEVAIVSTCNRFEVYAVTPHYERLAAWLTTRYDIPGEYLYTAHDEAAVAHLMRVSAGLDSLILGEPQILGQVTDALRLAQSAETLSATLSHLFTAAIHAGKRVRTETEISRYTLSVSGAAALLAARMVDLERARVLLVGAGEMALLAAKALRAHAAGSLTVISRTHTRAEALAQVVDADALGWDALPHALAHSDVMITATSAPHTIFLPEHIQAARPDGRGMLIIDIAVPRDVDARVRACAGVTLFDVDDLRGVVDQHRSQREAAAIEAEGIVREETTAFLHWLNSRDVVPVIVDLRRQVESIVEAEIAQALNRLGGLDARQQAVVTQMAHRIANKLLHKPTAALKSRAAQGDAADYAQTVRDLFDLPLNERERTIPHA